MDEEFEVYCDLLGLNTTLIDRVEDVEQFYERVCPENLERIFITQSIDDEGEIQLRNLWFFSRNYVMEASNFRKTDDFDIFNIESGIKYIEFNKKDYDFEEADADSRLHVSVYSSDSTLSFNMVFNAVGVNCDRLADLITSYFTPKMSS